VAPNRSQKDSVNQPGIHVTSHKVDTGETQVVVLGEIDLATYAEVDRALEKLKKGVVLDLRNCEFMDSTGIRVILTHKERLESNGGHLRVLATRGPVYNLMEIAGVVEILDVTDSLRPPATA
jgi:anti-anti-sigma factor